MMISAQEMQHGDFDRHDGEMNFKDLELTEKQEEQIHDLKIDFKKFQIEKKADLKLAQIELHELMKDEVEGNKLDSAIEKVNKLRSELFKAKIKNRVEMHKLLTDEQKDQMKKRIMHRGRKHEKRGEKRERKYRR